MYVDIIKYIFSLFTILTVYFSFLYCAEITENKKIYFEMCTVIVTVAFDTLKYSDHRPLIFTQCIDTYPRTLFHSLWLKNDIYYSSKIYWLLLTVYSRPSELPVLLSSHGCNDQPLLTMWTTEQMNLFCFHSLEDLFLLQV